MGVNIYVAVGDIIFLISLAMLTDSQWTLAMRRNYRKKEQTKLQYSNNKNPYEMFHFFHIKCDSKV
jgi:hypothetical protein